MTLNLFLPQVTRVPITGPAPYNTLVCVSAWTYMPLEHSVVPGNLYSGYPVRVQTPFRLAGFDQRVAPPFDHTTTAWTSAVGPTADGHWMYQVDSVTGAGFDPADGTYYVDLKGSLYPADPVPDTCGGFVCLYYWVVRVTSFVLCYEPPIQEPPRGRSLRAVVAGRYDFERPPTVAELLDRRWGVATAFATDSVNGSTSPSGPCNCTKVRNPKA